MSVQGGIGAGREEPRRKGMKVRWFGQAAFLVSGERHTVCIDPFGTVTPSRGMRFDYPPIRDVTADLVLVTHEHMDHNGVEAIQGSPQVVRSTAGTFDTGVGTVVAVASEHDDVAGTRRGPNTIFVLSLDGLRICHAGDFGQAQLRDEQAQCIGRPDLLFLPVGGGPTVDAKRARAIVARLRPRWVVPMHYRTRAISFLEPADAFMDLFPVAAVHRQREPSFDTAWLPAGDAQPQIVVPAVAG